MSDKNIGDWEYGEDFYNDSENKKVRSFEEIAAECGTLMENPMPDETESTSAKLNELAEKIGKIKKMSSEGTDVYSIAQTLGYEQKFVSDVLITISGSPEDDTDMAIAYLLAEEYQD